VRLTFGDDMSKLPTSAGLKYVDKPAVPALHETFVHHTLAPVANVMSAGVALQRHTARAFHNGVLTTGLAVHWMDPQVWGEWMQLQAAVVQRLQKQTQDFGKGCAILASDYRQLKQSNTMSKLVEKQCNLLSQCGQLLSSQLTNLVTLAENINVDYSYWVRQKLPAAGHTPRPPALA
jgi:hypothetical protein